MAWAPREPPKPSWGDFRYGAGVPEPTAPDDHRVAAEAAAGAAAVLSRLQQSDQRSWGWLEDEGDRQAHLWLMDFLAGARPDDAVLSEEGRDDRKRLDHRRAWIVDPLDGSSDFGVGQPDWAVHVALAIDGELTAAAVAVPAMDSVFGTGEPPELRSVDREQPIVVVGRSRVFADGHRVADALDAQLASCGSAGVKAMLVVRGDADVYVHGSRLYEWDVAAPAAVAAAAGLHVSAPDGTPLRFNAREPVSPGLVVCRPELAEAVLNAIG